MEIDCPALHSRSSHYPARFSDRVPKIVRILREVRPEALLVLTDPKWRGIVAEQGDVFYAWTNSHGAVAAYFNADCQLGLMPDEFEVVEWHGAS
jgi:hypothetical protein